MLAPSEAPTEVGVKVLSSSEISVHWKHVLEKIVENYQVSQVCFNQKSVFIHKYISFYNMLSISISRVPLVNSVLNNLFSLFSGLGIYMQAVRNKRLP